MHQPKAALCYFTRDGDEQGGVDSDNAGGDGGGWKYRDTGRDSSGGLRGGPSEPSRHPSRSVLGTGVSRLGNDGKPRTARTRQATA